MILLLACTGPSPQADSSPAEPGRSEPVHDAASFEAAWAEALSLGFPEPHAVIDSYLQRMARGDGECPDDPRNLTDSHVNGCTSADGTFFMGAAEFIDAEGLRSLTGDCLMRDPDGAEFEFGAAVVLSWTESEQELVLMGTVRDQAREDWLGPGSSFILEAHDRGEELLIEGGASVGEAALDLSGLSLSGECVDGRVSLRGEDQRWYEAELACGCGELVFEGQELGPVCPELGPLSEGLERAFGPLPELP